MLQRCIPWLHPPPSVVNGVVMGHDAMRVYPPPTPPPADPLASIHDQLLRAARESPEALLARLNTTAEGLSDLKSALRLPWRSHLGAGATAAHVPESAGGPHRLIAAGGKHSNLQRPQAALNDPLHLPLIPGPDAHDHSNPYQGQPRHQRCEPAVCTLHGCDGAGGVRHQRPQHCGP